MTNWKRSSDAGTQDFGLKLHDPRLADALLPGTSTRQNSGGDECKCP